MSRRSSTVVLLPFLLLAATACGEHTTDPPDQPLDDGFEASFSWLDEGIMTPAKQQGDYGTCGVFTALGVFEALIKRHSGMDVDLSEQHYINASTTWTESGNSPMQVFSFLRDTGIVVESRLPYEARKTDALPTGPVDFQLSDFGARDLSPTTPEEARRLLKRDLLAYGPLGVAMDLYSDLPAHAGGVYAPSPGAHVTGGHWVVLAGWVDDEEVETGGYWIAKNSNGDAWGDNGFFNIAYHTSNVDRMVYTWGVYDPPN